MKMERVRLVKSLCLEVLSLTKDVEEVARIEQPHGSFVGPHPEVAALRRRSMDLTRALAAMRKP